MRDGELVAADQHTPTAYQQYPHAHHQEVEQEAAEADLHMQEGQQQALRLLAAVKTAQMDPPAAAVTDWFAWMLKLHISFCPILWPHASRHMLCMAMSI